MLAFRDLPDVSQEDHTVFTAVRLQLTVAVERVRQSVKSPAVFARTTARQEVFREGSPFALEGLVRFTYPVGLDRWSAAGSKTAY
jgi:hypothetical protein